MFIYKRYIIYLLLLSSFIFSSDINDKINRPFIESGSIESLIQSNIEYDELILVQIDVLDDSLLSLINFTLPDINLNIGLGSYHRVFPRPEFNSLEAIVSDSVYKIIKRPYSLPDNSRDYWIEIKQGSTTHGTFTSDDAISYTCDCVNSASDCVKLGWDSWYNPLDYWAEAWWAFLPPNYTSINEIRVNIRGAQCDDLPLWSETYMGMRDGTGNWSQDYELSIEYTDNLFVVPEVWSEGMLMPIIGSEDNYVIDEVTLQFFYTCSLPSSPISVISSDGSFCNHVDISWVSPEQNDDILGYNLYRDGELITSFQLNDSTFSDYGASENIVHEYCITSYGDCGESEASCNDGSIGNHAYEVSNVSASDGLYEDIIIVNWEASNNAQEYKIYRDGTWLGFVSQYSELEFIDQFIDFQIEYNYCVEAINDCGSSNFICDVGFSSFGLGDINQDSSLDVLDIVLVINFIMGYETPTNSQEWLSDINNDQIINIQDIILLVNLILD